MRRDSRELTHAFRSMVAGVVEQRMKAVRAVAAQKTIAMVERFRLVFVPLRPIIVRSREDLSGVCDALVALLDETNALVTPHLPQVVDEDDDDYF